MEIVKEDKLILTAHASKFCSLKIHPDYCLYTEGYHAQKY